jgi:glycosyltransferase involved in cell wall biosynthesis
MQSKSRDSAITVSYNGRFLSSNHPTGTHRSALAFLREIGTRKGIEVTVHGPLQGGSFAHLAFSPSLKLKAVKGDGKGFWHVWEQLCWPWVSGDLAINPLNTGPFLPFTPRQIIFAHDINLLRHPKNYSRAFWWWNRFASIHALRRARHLVCFTDYVKADLIERLGVPGERITVIPQGPGLPLASPEQPATIKEPFFLCVGGMQPHKNLKGCLEAWKISGLAAAGYKLKVVGKPQANYAPLGIGEDLANQSGVEFTGYVDDAVLAALYRAATAFIYPSFDEGFGLPVVEAFYLGAPVITSNCSCLPEIAGEAALLVDPADYSALAQAMRRLAGDKELRTRLMLAGSKRADLYTWRKAGDALLDLLQHLNAAR